ncbi:hypothetical protein MTO96_014505 [Rhipicephalus appendiculatus]
MHARALTHVSGPPLRNGSRLRGREPLAQATNYTPPAVAESSKRDKPRDKASRQRKRAPVAAAPDEPGESARGDASSAAFPSFPRTFGRRAEPSDPLRAQRAQIASAAAQNLFFFFPSHSSSGIPAGLRQQ